MYGKEAESYGQRAKKAMQITKTRISILVFLIRIRSINPFGLHLKHFMCVRSPFLFYLFHETATMQSDCIRSRNNFYMNKTREGKHLSGSGIYTFYDFGKLTDFVKK